MITPAHAEWVPLREVYHHALKQSPSPEATKIAIAKAHQDSQLRWRCTLREHKAQPGVMIDQPRPGMLVDAMGPPLKTPPAPLIEVTHDYAIPSSTMFDPPFDWERSRATRRDPATASLFEYVDIVTHRDDVLARWPVPVDRAVRAGSETISGTGDGDAGTMPGERPDGVEARVWAVAQLVKEWEKEHGSHIGVPFNKQLLPDIQELALARRMRCSDRTLRRVLDYLKDPPRLLPEAAT